MSFLTKSFWSLFCSSFLLLDFKSFWGMTLVFQYSSQSLLFNETMDRLLGCFLDLLLKQLKPLVFVFQNQEMFHVEDAKRTQQVPRIENRVLKISENYPQTHRLKQNQVPRIREIGSLQVHTRFLTVSLKKNYLSVVSLFLV